MAEIKWDLGKVQVATAAIVPKLNSAMALHMSRLASKGESHMKATAKWTDRTGNARNGLFGRYSFGGGVHTVTYGHSVPYGIWLEVRWSGRYAIIEPTVRKMGAEMMQGLERALDRLT